MPGEIAAVHGGDVSRLERSQLPGSVPVVEMATKTLQTLHRLESRFETVDEVHRAEPAEVAGGGRRQQIHAEVRRRRTPRDLSLGLFLKIVRWQRMVFRADEGLEEAPRATGDPAQCATVRGCQRHRARVGP